MCISTTYITSLIATISGISGVLIGAWIARNTAFKIIDRQEQNRDFLDLKNSFIPAMQILNKEPGSFTQDDFVSFRQLFNTQEIAMLRVSLLLKGYNLKRFNVFRDEYNHLIKQCNTYENCVTIIGIESNRTEIFHLINNLCDKSQYK